MVSSANNNGRFILPLLPQVTCPHCWHVFAPEQALYIAAHPELTGDARLGEDHQERFLPTRFNPAGAALDSFNFA